MSGAADVLASPAGRGGGGAKALAALVGARGSRMAMVLLAMWVALAAHPETREAFATPGNLSNLTAQVADIVIVGVGMTMVVLVGGIDLSVGAGIALTGVVAAKLQIDHAQPAWVAVAAALLVGLGVGLWHGLLVGRFKVPPFVATLSGFLAYRGLALVLADARGLAPMGADFLVLGALLPPAVTFLVAALVGGVGCALVAMGRARRRALALPVDALAADVARGLACLAVAAFVAFVYRGGMPAPVLIAIGVVALGGGLLARTRLGRWAYALGGNAEAARLSGVPATRVTMAVYALTGVLTALAGVVAAARTNGVTPGNAGIMRELHVITAVVIGGTSLQGGRGTVTGTLVGALVFQTLSNGMNLMNVDSNWQLVLTGAILLAASLLDSLSSKDKR